MHSDMNCFYASVEMMLKPTLKGKAVAVCGSTEDRHGIVLAKSEKAKKAGVKTGMINSEAKRICSDLILVEPHYDQYMKFSRMAHEIYYRYTDLVEPFGMDECWLDVTDCQKFIGSPEEIAEKIRNDIKNELGLTVSIGVSFNKIFAKLGSDMKKPDAITIITPDDFKEKVWPLPAGDLLYCGEATSKKLYSYGIETIGELAGTRPDFLRRLLGVDGLKLLSYANGTDSSRVMHKSYSSPVKSVGHGITCRADLETKEEVSKVILELSQDVGHRLRVNSLKAANVEIYIRGKDLSPEHYSSSLSSPSMLPCDIAKAAADEFNKRYLWLTPVRSVTVRATNLKSSSECVQLNLFADYKREENMERVEKAIENIRSRFGKKAITYASLLGDLKMPGDDRDMVKMPGMMYV